MVVWYISSTLYVERAASALGAGQHLGVHLLVHAISYAVVTVVWEVALLRKEVKHSLTDFSLASFYHTAGTAATLWGIWHIGGVTTQMVKLLEPVVVLLLLTLRKSDAQFEMRQLWGSLLIIVTVGMRLFIDPSFKVVYFLLALLISVWYPLRNTVWDSEKKMSSALWSCLFSTIYFISISVYNDSMGDLFHPSVLYPAGLFGMYQFSSLLVLDAVQPQMHSTLNVGKRCFVIIMLYFISEDFDMHKLSLYSVGLLGASMLSFKQLGWKSASIFAVFGFALLLPVIRHQRSLLLRSATS